MKYSPITGISFSRLFIMCVAAGAIPAAAGSAAGFGLQAFLIWNCLIAMLFITDCMVTPGRKQLTAERICGSKMEMGTENSVVLKISNRSRFRLKAVYTDDLPPAIRRRESNSAVSLNPYSEVESDYRLIPENRGRLSLGDIHVRYGGVLGMCMKRVRFAVRNEVDVYPILSGFSRYGRNMSNGMMPSAGPVKIRSFMCGTEFESLREYMQGDDAGKINWMASARLDRLIVNTFVPEKDRHIYIMVDSGRAMGSLVNRWTKLDYAAGAALNLTHAAVDRGDNAGLMVFDSEVRRFIPSGKGPDQFRLIAGSLYDVRNTEKSADYAAAIQYAAFRQKRRSLFCIFTELLNEDEAANLAQSLKWAAGKHVAMVVAVKDPVLVRTAASDIRSSGDLFMKSAAMRLLEERGRIREIFLKNGIPCLDILPDKLAAETVSGYMKYRI